MENHLKMLQTFAEEQVEQYVSDVVNKGTTDAKVYMTHFTVETLKKIFLFCVCDRKNSTPVCG